MLEGPLKSWISYFLGQYVESETLNVSTKLWKASERLKLENLTLKKVVIPSWLPFTLKTGFIGQFEADLPFSAIFGSTSAKIKFQDVLIVLAPLRHDESEQREEELNIIEQKLESLERDLQDRWEGPVVPDYTVPQECEGYFGVDGWLGRTMTKLIDNLQIDIRNLHIRIEGVWYPFSIERNVPPSSTTSSIGLETEHNAMKFAVGVSVTALSAVTTPSNWRIEGFDTNTNLPDARASESKSHLVFKLINALDLSVYIDPVALHFIHSRVHPKVLGSTLSRLREMGNKNARIDWWNGDESVHAHRFVIAPIAVSIKLTLNTAAQHEQTNDPRYDASFHLSKMAMSLDEEQLSVLNLLLDAYNGHDEWRLKVANQFKAAERAVIQETDMMEKIMDDYTALWSNIVSMKKDGIESIRKSKAWTKLRDMERSLPFELIVSLRNRFGSETGVVVPAGDRIPYANLLHEMGYAMGIPLPEITVSFVGGSTGLVLEMRNNNVVVARLLENSQGAKINAIKPGLILIRMNGKPLVEAIRFRSALDIEYQLDSMMETRTLTFRHPLVKAPQVTPSRLVSKVTFTSDDLTFRLVRARTKTVLTKMALYRPLLTIRGYGPDLFSYHQYDVEVGAFYIQNAMCEDSVGGKYCILSSVSTEDTMESCFRFSMNYLHNGHPDAKQGIIHTYGTKYSLHLGKSILVVEEDRMTLLMREWYEFCNAISDYYGDLPPMSAPLSMLSASSNIMAGNIGGTYLEDISSSTTLRSIASTDNDLETTPVQTWSYTYDVKLDQLLMFVSAKEKLCLPPVMASQPSYRSVLKQLVKKNSSTHATLPPHWVRATKAIILIQRYIRGVIVRRRKIISSQILNTSGLEREGWLYSRDDTLAFRRWRRSWCRLDHHGIFTLHADGLGGEQIDMFHVLGSRTTLLENVRKGPWGKRRASSLLEIRTSSGVLRLVLGLDSMEELMQWRDCIALHAITEARRRASTRGQDQFESIFTDLMPDGLHPQGSGGSKSGDHAGDDPSTLEANYSAVAVERLLLGGFSDVYHRQASLMAEKSKWISISVTGLRFTVDVHRVSDPERSAFNLCTTIHYLSLIDHRKQANHGVLHVGDEFLGMKDGELSAARLRSSRITSGPYFELNMTYRGTQSEPECFVEIEGLQIELEVSGWFLPLTILDVIWEILDVICVFWTDPTVTSTPPEDGISSMNAWFMVAALNIHIRAPIIEAYVEDTHCVAKLSLENSMFGYKANHSMEHAKVYLGPTALFVLTDEVALRLAQVEKCWMDYELHENSITSHDRKCHLCGKDQIKRLRCHRSTTMFIGQVKLEADRRLELLFALIEAMTLTEGSQTIGAIERPSTSSVMSNLVVQKDPFARPFDVNRLSVDCTRVGTERLPSMQVHDDPIELNAVYDRFGQHSTTNIDGGESLRRSPSSTQQGVQERIDLPRSADSKWIPLLNYQVYITILPSGRKSLFQYPIDVGNVADCVNFSCTSIVFEVIKRSLSVVALDTYIPVINFSVNDLRMQFLTHTEFYSDYKMDASVEISARYYNSALADWEPFIEPWRAYTKINKWQEAAKRKNEESVSGTSIQVTSMERLNVNFTDALVRLLSSVAKNRKKAVMLVEQRTPAAAAADGEAKKEDGRVCVLNNLGVPIRLANLNTSQPGTLHVEVRDGWSFPGYTRFHDVRVDVVLLPWWYPRESKILESVNHKFSLPYGGAQSGVTPIMRLDVLSYGQGKRNFVFDQITNQYLEVEEMERDFAVVTSSTRSIPTMVHNETPASTLKDKWHSVGTVEIKLVGSVMGSLGTRGRKLSRWYRLHDHRGNATGEIFVALEFVPNLLEGDGMNNSIHEPDQVKDGQFLVFDPLKVHATKESSARKIPKTRPDATKQIVLSHGLRGSYVPPLALEVMIGSSRCSLLCPLKRAGKFLIQGDKVLAEVKVAQRDETRRVLLLSSPVQMKNETSLDVELWTCPTDVPVGMSGRFDESNKLSLVWTNNKISIPLGAMYDDEKHSIIVKVRGCRPMVIANLGNLTAKSSIIALEPEENSFFGYCFYVNIVSHMRKVYREDLQDVVTRSGGNGTRVGRESEMQSYATKYRISLHSSLVFENTLPIRVQYRVIVPTHENSDPLVLRTGTLAPGEDVHLCEFHQSAQLTLRLPEMDSIWCPTIHVGECIFREGMDRSVKTLLGASGSARSIVEFLPSLQVGGGTAFEQDDQKFINKKIIARLDYTIADDGSPRVVLYSSLWIYNLSHVQTLRFQCADDHTLQPVVVAPQILSDRPSPRLMDCPKQAFEIGTIIDHEVSKWSDKIHTTVVGTQAPISLKFPSHIGPTTRNEIGISIQRPLGQFHRTTQVIVTSRFVLVNKTTSTFQISSRDGKNMMQLPPTGVPVPFDFNVGNKTTLRHLYIQMEGPDAKWSGPFAADEEKEFPLVLQGYVHAGWNNVEQEATRYEEQCISRAHVEMNRVKIRIHSVGPTMVVTIMCDDPPMYLIRNESSLDVYVHQQHCSNTMIAIPSMQYVPFAWTEPESSTRVTCRVGKSGDTAPSGIGSRVYDFNNLDRDRGFEDLKFWMYGNKFHHISAEIVVEDSSRVLVFRNQNSEEPPRYVLDVKVITARFFHELSMIQHPSAQMYVETENHSPVEMKSKEIRTTHIYRFDTDTALSCPSRPKRLILTLYQHEQDQPLPTQANINGAIDILTEEAVHDNTTPQSPMGGGDGCGDFNELHTPQASPCEGRRLTRQSKFYQREVSNSHNLGDPLVLSDANEVNSLATSPPTADIQRSSNSEPSGIVEIRIPRKAWTKFGVNMRQSLAWSHNSIGPALNPGSREGHWWEMRHPETGELIGEVKVALKFRTTMHEHVKPKEVWNMSVLIPSIGFSFLHNAHASGLVEVAYLSLQRLGLIYTSAGSSSEIACSLGNVQMDNQMDSEVVLGPKVHRVKEGVSVRLRDRWRSFQNYRYRGIYEKMHTTNLNFIRFRMLWNSKCRVGDITHYELVEFVMREVEISTDEKFVVNLITVFQGIGSLASHHTFEQILDTHFDYTGGGTTPNDAMVNGVYIEELAVEAVRVKFSMELNGGRHIKTLGPYGRRLAVYLPESNVKDFRLYFSNVTYTHMFDTKTNVIEKVTRRYQQQAVVLVLRGLHTVSVYANPFRIAYRFGHGLLEVVRLPARGLASGSPVELVTGTYLGVRSLAMNTISAGYEIVAGATGILTALIAPLLPESRRRGFEEEMLSFQRAVIEEVDSFDAVEERTMTKTIVRKPRVFDPHGVGLVTVYGPGSVPLEEQDRIDHRAVVLLQQWWRRRLRINIILAEAVRLRPDLVPFDSSAEHTGCIVM